MQGIGLDRSQERRLMKSSSSSTQHETNKKPFLKHFIYFELRLAGVFLLLLSVVALWQSGRNTADDVAEIRATPAPEGMHSMDYCDGGLSEALVPLAEAGCLADYPGEFALEAVAAMLGLLFLFISLIAFVVFMRRNRLADRQKKHP
jgi:hypothetical protein